MTETNANIYILGAGSPIATPDYFGTSQAVQIGDEYLLFDCGPTTTYQLARVGIPVTAFDHLFFTHHHFDHNAGYATFVLSRWDQGLGRVPDLKVFGPRNTALITDRLFGEQGAHAFDIEARAKHELSLKHYVSRGGTLPRLPPHIDARDVGPGIVFAGNDWEVRCALGEHVEPYHEMLALRLDTDGFSLAITGDTAPVATVEELVHGADVMVTMCGGSQERQRKAGTNFGQMGTTWAGELAQRAEVKKMILTHFGPGFRPGGTMESGIREIAAVYDGQVIYPHELMKIPLQ